MPRAYELFRQVRKERVWTERLEALEEAILAHYVQLPRTPPMDIRPPYIEFALMKECRVLAQATLTRKITSDDFSAIIPGLADRWFAEKADMLDHAYRRIYGPPPTLRTHSSLPWRYGCADTAMLACASLPCSPIHARTNGPIRTPSPPRSASS